MNRALFITAIVAVATAAGVRAQTPAPGRGRSAPDPARVVAIGCISRTARPAARGSTAPRPTFTITDTRNDPPLVYRLDGDAADLEFHAGHLVEITGTLTAAASGPSGIKIASLTYIATTCPKKPGR